jgi:hypothetical protein
VDVATALLSDLAQLADSVDLDVALLQTPLKLSSGSSALRSVPTVGFSSPSSATASLSP